MKGDDLTPVWGALTDPTRRAILDLLRERPRTTGELCGAFPLSRFAVMKHLGVPEDAGLIAVRQRGRERWNHLNAVPLQQIVERWLRPYEAHWAKSLLQLKRHVEAAQGGSPMAEQTMLPTLGTLHIEQDITINAAPAQVFAALPEDIAAWWGKPY
jgi:DNA-binding transcriptional ArsR family regulator